MEHFYFIFFASSEGLVASESVRSAPDNLLWSWSATLRARQSENAQSLEVMKNVSEGLFF